MKMIASRELASSPARVWQLLEKEGSVVITKDGKPRGILLPTSEETLLEDLESQIFQRARRAVTQVRQRTVQRGLPTDEEIQMEIREARKNRSRR
jgi:hypothetical protein